MAQVDPTAPASQHASDLERALGLGSLTMIGVSSAIGAGIFVIIGMAAARFAGPAVAVSFLIAALVCLTTALCYAELASAFPNSGSAYTYIREAFGIFPAWIIGWCLILEYLVAASSIAVGWSGYFSKLVAAAGIQLSPLWVRAPFDVAASGYVIRTSGMFDLPAFVAIAGCTIVLALGLRETVAINNIVVTIKIVALAMVVAIGFYCGSSTHWRPFIPSDGGNYGVYGWSGVFRAAGIVFLSFIGFEAISTSASEARDPRRDIPRAMLLALAICTVIYVAVSLALTRLVDFHMLDAPSPIAIALDAAGSAFIPVAMIVEYAAAIGLLASILATLYGQSRIAFIMAHDGLLPGFLGRINVSTQTPVAGTVLIGAISAMIAGLVPLAVLGELISMGTLLAFAGVCGAVIRLRRSRPDIPRSFSVPMYPYVPVVGMMACVGLMTSLPLGSWVRLGLWICVGALVYVGFVRGRKVGLRSESVDATTIGV